MSELSAQSTENARNLEKEAADMEAFILQRLARIGQNVVASRMNISETSVSRMKDGAISEMARFLVAIDAVVAGRSDCRVSQAELFSLLQLSGDGLSLLKKRYGFE